MAPNADATAGASQGWHDLEAVLAEETAATLLAAYLVPLHRRFDRLVVFGMKLWQPLGIDGQGDRASDARLPRDQPSPLEGQQHLVHRRWADPKEVLDVGFGRGATVQAPIGVDEGEVLPLPWREAGSILWGSGVHLEPSMRGGRDEHTLPGGVERGGAQRTHGHAEWWPA